MYIIEGINKKCIEPLPDLEVRQILRTKGVRG
jgi:hypothetical protein